MLGFLVCFLEELSAFEEGVIEVVAVVRSVAFLFCAFVSVFEFEFEFDLGLIMSLDSLLVSLRFTFIFIFCLKVLICIDDENDSLFFLFKLLQLAVFVIKSSEAGLPTTVKSCKISIHKANPKHKAALSQTFGFLKT